jgi:hypothetical protein
MPVPWWLQSGIKEQDTVVVQPSLASKSHGHIQPASIEVGFLF